MSTRPFFRQVWTGVRSLNFTNDSLVISKNHTIDPSVPGKCKGDPQKVASGINGQQIMPILHAVNEENGEIPSQKLCCSSVGGQASDFIKLISSEIIISDLGQQK